MGTERGPADRLLDRYDEGAWTAGVVYRYPDSETNISSGVE